MPLPPRQYGLPPDLQYVLDGACDCHEIMGHHHYALWNYGTAEEIDAIFNEPRAGNASRRTRRIGCLGLVRYAEGIIAEMDEVERAAMAVFAYGDAENIVAEYAQFLASWNFEDGIKGGCALPFRKTYRGTADGVPSPRLRRRLYGPDAIRRYVKLYEDWDWLQAVVAGVSNLPVPHSRDLPAEFLRREEEMRAARRRYEAAAFEEMRERSDAARKRLAEKPRDRRRRQGVIKRASVMAAALLGAGTVSAFARGEPIRIPGQEVAFELRSTSRLGHIGHGGVEVAIVSHDGKRLSKLCVYHDETPALDQLTAFALRIAAGDEREIISTGNLYAVEGNAADHPVLIERLNARATEIVYGGALRGGHILGRDDQFRLRCSAYCIETAPVYRRAVAHVLFGRRAPLFLRGVIQ